MTDVIMTSELMVAMGNCTALEATLIMREGTRAGVCSKVSPDGTYKCDIDTLVHWIREFYGKVGKCPNMGCKVCGGSREAGQKARGYRRCRIKRFQHLDFYELRGKK